MSLKKHEISTAEDMRISIETKAILIYIGRLLPVYPSVDGIKNIEQEISNHLLGEDTKK